MQMVSATTESRERHLFGAVTAGRVGQQGDPKSRREKLGHQAIYEVGVGEKYAGGEEEGTMSEEDEQSTAQTCKI